MLPHAIYESLPYLYLGFASLASAASEFNGFVLACAAVMTAASAMIIRMRRSYRRELRLAGGTRHIHG
ncbi:MAG: hypothetical protein KDH20_09125 [Rhodocyclaceae bacterium]|nr:hypothetical protein [Rhodocyclaceae bacterium]MCB1958817.1 hypothetical protein [Rhodocyclaceae bacterium]